MNAEVLWAVVAESGNQQTLYTSRSREEARAKADEMTRQHGYVLDFTVWRMTPDHDLDPDTARALAFQLTRWADRQETA